MRIAVVTDAWHPQVNGVVRALSYLEREVRAMGHDLLMVTPLGQRTIPCPTYPEIRLVLNALGSTTRKLREFAPDAVHIATEGPLGLAARRYCTRRRLPFTTSFHTRFPEYLEMRWPVFRASCGYRFLRWFHGGAVRTMITTQTLSDELAGKGFENLVLWSRGVDTELFRPTAQYATVEAPVFLYMGRVAPEKNIEAFLELDLPGVKQVIGDGPAREGLRKKFPQVQFLGLKQGEELARLVAGASVFVFPSRTDTLGLVIMEAMACGVPVAAYPVQGPANLIQEGLNGCLDEDLERAARRALMLQREPVRASAMRYSWRESMNEFISNLAPCTAEAKTA